LKFGPVAVACASRSARSSGVAGNIAAQAVIGSQPDSYRLLVVTTAGATNATLYPRLPFNFLRDVAPVARLVRMVNLAVVHPSVPANTLGEFVAPVIEKAGIKGSL
jgi:tripartite-type tricarboxylate transporter receptor subunit TctC